MTENVYEGLFILDSNRYGRDQAGVSGRVTELIEKQGGILLVSRLWEERRLAYSIRGQRKGTYWLTYFRLESEKVAALNEQVQRDDNMLRHLFVKIDPRVVDALVSHTQDAEVAAREPATETASDSAPADDTEIVGATADAAVAIAEVE